MLNRPGSVLSSWEGIIPASRCFTRLDLPSSRLWVSKDSSISFCLVEYTFLKSVYESLNFFHVCVMFPFPILGSMLIPLQELPPLIVSMIQMKLLPLPSV